MPRYTLFVSIEMLLITIWVAWNPYLILRRAAIYITIFGYTLFLYGLTFCYISLHSFFWETENKGALGVIWGDLSLAVSCYAALSSHYYFYFFANNQVILTQIQHKQLFTNSYLRQLKFTIMWQYKFLNYNSYNLTINISLKYKK